MQDIESDAAGRVLRERAVRDMTGLSRVTRWRMERSGQFPRRVKLSPNAIGWFQGEIDIWLKSRPRGLSQVEDGD